MLYCNKRSRKNTYNAWASATGSKLAAGSTVGTSYTTFLISGVILEKHGKVNLWNQTVTFNSLFVAKLAGKHKQHWPDALVRYGGEKQFVRFFKAMSFFF